MPLPTHREIIIDARANQCGVRFYFGLGLAPYAITTAHTDECWFEDETRICTCGALRWPEKQPRIYAPKPTLIWN